MPRAVRKADGELQGTPGQSCSSSSSANCPLAGLAAREQVRPASLSEGGDTWLTKATSAQGLCHVFADGASAGITGVWHTTQNYPHYPERGLSD